MPESNKQSYKTSLRFSKLKDLKRLEFVLKQYPNEKPSTIFRKLILAHRDPVVSQRIREELYLLVIELNAIGRNLNQLLKHQSFKEAEMLISHIQEVVKK